MYGMRKTTVYLDEEMKHALERAASTSGRSEAELIREAVGRLVAEIEPPRPRLPLYRGDGDPIARTVDDHMEGFGTR